ncbi:PREDICTED: gonadotropin-releasing hormone receptor [Polistes dominula]|uniref:Gonadotropin-releasing hormone receptor n=1 Tax=Polistes dominula TaxID=743375 RepID=A0ABM1I6W6_POLDO|nr:PREDICTED: gonadotropin-releasing hormone receptor [Polistes dominula]
MKKIIVTTMETLNSSVLFLSTVENLNSEMAVDPTDMLNQNTSGVLTSNNFTFFEHAPKLTDTGFIKVIVLAFLSIVSLIANLATIYSVIKNRRKRQSWSAIYTLILHLSIADLLVTIFCIGGEAIWSYTVQWIWGNISCKIFKFLQVFSLYLSTFILVLIGVDRFVAIRYPMKSLNTTHRYLRFVAIAWILSTILALPQIVIFHVARGPFVEEFIQCVTHGFYTEPWQEKLYVMLSIFFMFLLPLTILITTYVSTIIALSRSEDAFKSELINNNLQRTNSDINRKKLINRAKTKSLQISILIVAAFIVWWTPYYTMMIIFIFLNPNKNLTKDLLNIIFFFGMTNSLVNPLIYGAFHLWPKRKKRNFYFRDLFTLRGRKNRTNSNDSTRELQETRPLFVSRGIRILTNTFH